jgi:hypothetical protein
MKRRLFNMLAAASLVLCVASVVLWVRSYRSLASLGDHDSVTFTYRDPRWWIISYPGVAVLCRQTGKDWTGHDLPHVHMLGIDFGGSQGPTGDTIWNLRLPYWLLTAVTLVLPPLSMHRRWKTRHRQRGNECCVCGYDLRATPNRCPECGTAAGPAV